MQKQQQQISNIIESYPVITKQEIGRLREEINDLKKSIEFTENVLEEKIEEDVTYMNDYMEDAENIHNKLVSKRIV